jgi:hypothetical protein
MRPHLACLLAIALSGLLVSEPALGHPRAGLRLTYYLDDSAKSRMWEARVAARAWNLSGAKVRITRVRSRRTANIIVYGGRIDTGLTVSRGRRIWVFITTLRERSRVNVAMIMAHELGHTLGLEHRKGCVLMNPASECALNEGDSERWNCRMVRRGDVRDVARRWGGSWAPKLPETCPRADSGPTRPLTGDPALNPPNNLQASHDPSGDGTSW